MIYQENGCQNGVYVLQMLKSPRTPQLNTPHAEKFMTLMPGSTSGAVRGPVSASGSRSLLLIWCACQVFKAIFCVAHKSFYMRVQYRLLQLFKKAIDFMMDP